MSFVYFLIDINLGHLYSFIEDCFLLAYDMLSILNSAVILGDISVCGSKLSDNLTHFKVTPAQSPTCITIQ
jgi:hypothetical protein